MALFAVLLCVNFASCNNDENEVPQIGEEIMVSLGFGGEISVSESPFSRTDADDKPDLYGIQIYSCPTSSESSASYTPYAYGLFDDITSVNVSLVKGYKYKVSVLLIKNGKNIVRFWAPGITELYSEPFNTPITNSFILNTVAIIRPNGNIIHKDGSQYSNSNAEKYYGETTDFIPSEDNNSINIFMKKMFFGGKFIAENLTEGTLSIIFEQFVAPQIDITASENTLTRTFTISDVKSAYNSEDYTDNLKMQITWEKNDGALIPLGTHTIAFKRNKMHTVTIKVGNVTSSPSLSVTFEDTEMGEGESTTIENGEIIDTNINTGTEG